MNCDNYRKMITDMIAGELSEKEKSDLEKHLSSCEACRNEMKEQVECFDLIGSALMSEKIESSLGDERHEEISQAANKKSGVVPFSDLVRKFVWLELAAGIVLCTAIAFILHPTIRDFGRSLNKEKSQAALSPAQPGEKKIADGKDKGKEAPLRESEMNFEPLPAKAVAVPEKPSTTAGKVGYSEQAASVAPSATVSKITTTSATPLPAMRSAKAAPAKLKEEASKAPIIADKKKRADDILLDTGTVIAQTEKGNIAKTAGEGGVSSMPAKAPAMESFDSREGRAAQITLKDEDLGSNRQVIQGFRGQNLMIETLSRTYQMDLKSIGVSDEKTFREYLERNGAKFADHAKISLDFEKNTVIITAPSNAIAEADVFLVRTAKAKIKLSPAAEAGSKADVKMSK
ncbi:MAG TPA: hypothetical protein DCZ94_05540 [Lentisphaeria bacterium]|nr:MAG: hypothetical protein A2X48_14885 [Lentisphaerae bacterium GWF2_49_21]HBC86399.1 hypothetical protein [Lentisphaeria bacterium]